MLKLSHRLPLTGILFSSLILRSGTAVTSLALPWLINAQTASSFWTSLSVSSCFITSVFGTLLGGVLIDRIGPTVTVRIVGLCGAVSIALVPLLFQFNTLTPILLITLLACTTLFDAIASSTQDSRIPEIAVLAEIPLRRVVAAKSVIGYIATLSVPLVAGIAARVWGTERTLLHSAVALLLGGITSSLAMARVGHCHDLCSHKTRSGESALTGLIILWHNRFLRSLVFFSSGSVAIVSATSVVIAPKLVGIANGDIQSFGGFMAALSGGSILGSIIYGMLGHRFKVCTIYMFGFSLISISMLLLWFFSSIPVLVISGIILGTAASPMTTAMSVILFKHIDFNLRGRSFGLVTAIITSVAPVAMILIGYCIDKLGLQSILILLAIFASAALFIIPNLLNQTDSATGKP